MEKCRVYSLSTCSHCKSCKRFLGDCGVEFDFMDVDLLSAEDRAEAMAEIKRLTSRCSFPTVVIGERVIVGFKEDEIREALGL